MEDPNNLDLYSVLKTAWKGRKTIILTTLVVAILGMMYAFLTPRTYTASTVMVPQLQSRSSALSNLGGLEGLASMAGINLSGMTQSPEDISPLVYPEIVKSYDFIQDIMYHEYTFSKADHPVTLAAYAETYGKPGFFGRVFQSILEVPGKLSSWISPPPVMPAGAGFHAGPGRTVMQITQEESELWNALTKSINLSVDKKNGYVTLVVEGQEPLATAQIADRAQQLLQEKITEYRIEKTRQNLDFIQERYNEKKTEFEVAQNALATFRDAHTGSLSNRRQSEQDQLESAYQLAFNVYSELAKQLETAKISVKEDTPIFSVIQSVIVPVKPSKPRKMVILMISVLLGAAIGVTWVFAKKHWQAVA